MFHGSCCPHRTAIQIQKRFRAKRIGIWRNVKVRRLVAEFMQNKKEHIELAKTRTKRNFFRIRALLRKDECEDLNDEDGVVYDWYQYWDDDEKRWMWYSGKLPLPIEHLQGRV